MKVLIAADESAVGGYVGPLARALRARGVEVVCSVERAVGEPDPSVDLLHVQWPEALCRWRKPDHGCLRTVRSALERWRDVGTSVVATRHNALPHHHRDHAAEALYDVVYGAADGVVHLGRPSLEAFEGRDRGPQWLIPHGVDLDAEATDRTSARRELRIPEGDLVVLVYGAIRTVEEQRLIVGTARRAEVGRTVWLVPRWGEATRPPWLRRPLARVGAALLDRVGRRLLRTGEGPVDDARTALLFGAADVAFIPRIDALNSGVAPLAFGYATAVLGPRIGNIGWLLDETGNPGYTAGDPADAARALARLPVGDLAALGRRNRARAEAWWGWDEIAARHEDFYREMG